MKLIVLGSPGVGKGTYAQELVKELGLAHISSGDLFREHIRNKTKLGIEADKHISIGHLVPDELTIAMIKERLSQPDCKKGFVLDGFPRTAPQAEALDKITPIDLVLYFKADREVIIDRLGGRRVCTKCKWIYHVHNIAPQKEGVCDQCAGEVIQRADDNPKVIAERLDVYERDTAPLIQYYKNKKLLSEVIINEEFGKHRDIIMNRIYKAIIISRN